MLEGVVRRMPGDGQPDIRVRPAAAMVDDFDAVGDTRELGTEVAPQIEAATDERATHRSGRLGR